MGLRRSFLLAIALLVYQISAIIKVDPSTQFFVDETGRVRLFHGVNAVYKLPPWHPSTEGFDASSTLSDTDAQNLASWGFNAVRLGVMWPGVEPEKGKYNSTYLSVMKEIVDTLGNHGIYTIVDFHQDLLNRKYCGEGIPDWATHTDPITLPFPLPVARKMAVDPQTQYPSLEDCLKHNFADYYFSDMVGNAFQNFYDDTNGVQERFAGFWVEVASVFNNTESVLGYEIINEPWAGDVFVNPDLLIPGVADRQNLAPMYSMIHDAIRQVDNEHILFFEKALVDVEAPSGLTEGPGGPQYNDRQAYSYHIYCFPTDNHGNPSNIFECDFVDEYFYDLSMDDVRTLGCGAFLTEFGAMGNASISMQSIDFLTNAADKRLQSWTYWQFKLYDDITTQGNGESLYSGDNLEVNKVKALSRTYAPAIAGIPTLMSFDPNTAIFQFSYALDTTITAPTVVFLNEQFYYPKGYSVVLTPSGVVKWSKSAQNYIQIVPANSSVKNGQQVTITITPQQ